MTQSKSENFTSNLRHRYNREAETENALRKQTTQIETLRQNVAEKKAKVTLRVMAWQKQGNLCHM